MTRTDGQGDGRFFPQIRCCGGHNTRVCPGKTRRQIKASAHRRGRLFGMSFRFAGRYMSSSTAYEASTMAAPTTLISSPARHNLSFMKMKLANVVSPAVTVAATSRGTANTASPYKAGTAAHKLTNTRDTSDMTAETTAPTRHRTGRTRVICGTYCGVCRTPTAFCRRPARRRKRAPRPPRPLPRRRLR